MASDDDLPDVTARDAIQIAQRALAKVNEIEREHEGELEELRDDYDSLREDYVALKFSVQERRDNTSYREYTTSEKVGMVREHAFRKAVDGYGRAKLDYKAIRWEVFDAEEGPGVEHAYKLMRLAAGVNQDGETIEEVPGFEFRDPPNENQHLAVDAEQAKQAVAFSSEKKATNTGGSR